MADTYLTLTDLAKINDLNARDNGMSDILDSAPFLKVVYATTASNGTTHKYLKQTGAPVVGFRAVGAGLDKTNYADTEISIDLKWMDCDDLQDVAYVDGYRKGREAAIQRGVLRKIKAGFFAFEQQVFNGQVGAASGGFAGLADSLHNTASSMVVNAGGTTATTGSSIYLVRSAPDETGVAAVFGNDGTIQVSPSGITLATDGSGKSFSAYLTQAGAWLGFQVGGAFSVARIANITADSGKGATDSLIYSAIKLFKSSEQPTHIVMNRRSLEQLRKSRTATNATGSPAPRPTDVDGIPIVVTDALAETEALLTASS